MYECVQKEKKTSTTSKNIILYKTATLKFTQRNSHVKIQQKRSTHTKCSKIMYGYIYILKTNN